MKKGFCRILKGLSRNSGVEESLPARGPWQVYVIACSDATLYTGITTDIDRRFGQHAAGRGARYFRGRKPHRVVFLETGHTRSSASCREAEIKHFSRAEKLRLILSPFNQLGRRCEQGPEESRPRPPGS